jgi:hypothetical protein
MSSTDLQTASFLFLIFFPLNVVFWSVVFVGSGTVHNVSAMPLDYRLALRSIGADKTPGRSPLTVPTAIFCLILFNIPVVFLLIGRYGATSAGIAVAYLALQTLWVERIRRAARRSRIG